MTPMEYKILLLLMKNPGRVFSAEEIYERVWNERAVNTDTIMVHVRNIREKIEINPKEPKYLKVVWGVGYKIENKHKLAVILIALTIFLPAMAVIQQYPKYYRQTAKVQESIDKSAVCSSSFMEKFIGAGYLLYNTENSEEDGEDTAEEVKEMLGENEPTFLNDFEELYRILTTGWKMRTGSW